MLVSFVQEDVETVLKIQLFSTALLMSIVCLPIMKYWLPDGAFSFSTYLDGHGQVCNEDSSGRWGRARRTTYRHTVCRTSHHPLRFALNGAETW